MDVSGQLHQLRRYVEDRDFAGYDPYDALNSPLVRTLTCGQKWLRIISTQALRRSPFNFRPLLGIRPGHNPKALGLFLSAYSILYRLDPAHKYLVTINYLIDRLAVLRSKGCTGNGWGYNFDWQSRAFFLPRFTPTIVNSAFVGHALLDAYEATGSRTALTLALPTADFILTDLYRVNDGETFCFSYTPLDRYPVHNANLLGASLLIRLFNLTGKKEEKIAALTALAYTMKHQRTDGSWPYSEWPVGNWVDSFHTGFVLDALRQFLVAGHSCGHRDAYERGVQYYTENFFLVDGTPKYYHDRIFPIDIHAAAEAVSFLSESGPEHRVLRERVLRWMLSAMFDHQRSYFYYQQTKHFTNRICYMRWSQAWAFKALAQHMWASSAPRGDLAHASVDIVGNAG